MLQKVCLELNQSIQNHFEFLNAYPIHKTFCLFLIDDEDNLVYSGYQGAYREAGTTEAICGATYFHMRDNTTAFFATGTEIYLYRQDGPGYERDLRHLKFRLKNPNIKVFKTPEEFWRDKNDT